MDSSYSPLNIEGSNAFSQIVRTAVISPWAFIGFESVAHFSEEYTFPVKKIRRILILSVIVTTALYIFISLLSVSAYPPEYSSWQAYIQDMGNLTGIKAVPAFYAAYHYLGQTGVTVLMCALFGVILTSLIGNLLALSRLLYAAGRDGDAPKTFKKLNKRGIPSNAVYVIVAVSVFIPFLGRMAIGWIVDATKIICDIYQHSPVFRIGGDEYAVISQGSDFEQIEELTERMNAHNAEAVRTGGIVIACGMAKRGTEHSVAVVFERADQEMYLNKSSLKEKEGRSGADS